MKDILEDLKNLEDIDEDLPEPNNLYKQIMIITISIFMIILILSYFLIGFPVRNVLVGQIYSNVPEGNILETRDARFIFRNDTLETAYMSWENNPYLETTLCIHGSYGDGVYHLYNAYEPEIYEQSLTHIKHASCDADTIVMFHTHPYKRCIASETDIRTLRRAQLNNEDIAMIIMCEENRFSVYR